MDGTNTKDYKRKAENLDTDFGKAFCTSLVPLQLSEKITKKVFISQILILLNFSAVKLQKNY